MDFHFSYYMTQYSPIGPVAQYAGSVPGYALVGFVGPLLFIGLRNSQNKLLKYLGFAGLFVVPFVSGLVYGYDVFYDATVFLPSFSGKSMRKMRLGMRLLSPSLSPSHSSPSSFSNTSSKDQGHTMLKIIISLCLSFISRLTSTASLLTPLNLSQADIARSPQPSFFAHSFANTTRRPRSLKPYSSLLRPYGSSSRCLAEWRACTTISLMSAPAPSSASSSLS